MGAKCYSDQYFPGIVCPVRSNQNIFLWGRFWNPTQERFLFPGVAIAKRVNSALVPDNSGTVL